MKKLYLAAAVVSIGSFLQAYVVCIIAGALGLITSEFHISPAKEGLVASIIFIGALLGAGIGGPVADRWGRKKALLAIAFLYVISSLLILPTGTVAHILFLRFAIGIAVGMTSILVPLYLAEMAPASKRGLFVTFFQLSQTVGTLAAYSVSYSMGNWRLMLMVAFLPALFQLCALPFLSESPAWKSQQFSKVSSSSWKELLNPTYRFALWLGIGIAVVQQLSGINGVFLFAPKLFAQVGIENVMLPTMMLGVVNILCTVASAFFVDQSGRRKIYLFSLAGVALSLLLMMVLFTYASGLTLLACISYLACFSLGLGSVTWVLISEFYPLSIRAKAISLITLLNWASGTFTVFILPILLSLWGVSGVWAPFLLITLAAFPFFFRWIPETKNKTLDELALILYPVKKN